MVMSLLETRFVLFWKWIYSRIVRRKSFGLLVIRLLFFVNHILILFRGMPTNAWSIGSLFAHEERLDCHFLADLSLLGTGSTQHHRIVHHHHVPGSGHTKG